MTALVAMGMILWQRPAMAVPKPSRAGNFRLVSDLSGVQPDGVRLGSDDGNSAGAELRGLGR